METWQVIKRLKWWYYRRYKHDIHPSEMEHILRSGVKLTPWIAKQYPMLHIYAIGIPIKKIAEQYNVTRERVRQIAWKAWRESNKGRTNE